VRRTLRAGRNLRKLEYSVRIVEAEGRTLKWLHRDGHNAAVVEATRRRSRRVHAKRSKTFSIISFRLTTGRVLWCSARPPGSWRKNAARSHRFR
jgi:hypothetical protein